MDEHAELVKQVSIGIWKHFKGNEYLVLGTRVDWTKNGTARTFVYYIPLYDNPSEYVYRRLIIGTEPGEEDGWLTPVNTAEYQGPRFELLKELTHEEVIRRIRG